MVSIGARCPEGGGGTLDPKKTTETRDENEPHQQKTTLTVTVSFLG